MPERPFSISSIHSTAGATLSATRMALRRFSSDEPTRPEKMRPTSRRSSGQAPLGGHRLGGEALAAALDAQEQKALGLREAELARRLGERGGPPPQPVLEVVQAADLPQPLLDRVVLEQAALADDLPLLLQDQLHVVGVQAVVLRDGLGERVLRLRKREAQGGLHQRVGLAAVHVDGRAVALAQDLHDLDEQPLEVVLGGQRDVEDGDLLLQLHRDGQAGGEEDQRGVRRLEVMGQLAQPAHDHRVVQERMEVLQDHQRRLAPASAIAPSASTGSLVPSMGGT